MIISTVNQNIGQEQTKTTCTEIVENAHLCMTKWNILMVTVMPFMNLRKEDKIISCPTELVQLSIYVLGEGYAIHQEEKNKSHRKL